MPEVKTYVCDHCGHQSTCADHWLIAERKGGSFRVYTWETGIKLASKREYYCGQACLLAVLVEHLHQSSLRPQKPEVVPCRLAEQPLVTAAASAGAAHQEVIRPATSRRPERRGQLIRGLKPVLAFRPDQ